MSPAIRRVGPCGRSCTNGGLRDEDATAGIVAFVTFFADLTPYTYWSTVNDVVGEDAYAASGRVLNVGWLSAGEPFPTGEPPPGLVDNLLRRATCPVHVTRGVHLCELCDEPIRGAPLPLDGELVHAGNAEIQVTGADATIYAAPTLIAHYVAEHRYLPPEQFIDAALHGPEAAGVARMGFMPDARRRRRPVSRADAKELARRECERRGLLFAEPVSVSGGPLYFRVRTQTDTRGGNVSLCVQRWTGRVELQGVAPR
jgi:hypothetical protein